MPREDQSKVSLSLRPAGRVRRVADALKSLLDPYMVLQDHCKPVVLTSRSSSFCPGGLAFLLAFRGSDGGYNSINQGHRASSNSACFGRTLPMVYVTDRHC